MKFNGIEVLGTSFKVRTKAEERNPVDGSVVYDDTQYTPLFSNAQAYDRNTGLGKITIGKTEIVFVEDETTHLGITRKIIVPFVRSISATAENATMVIGITDNKDGSYTIDTAAGGKKFTVTPAGSDIDDVQDAMSRIDAEKDELNRLYQFVRDDRFAKPFVRRFIPIRMQDGSDPKDATLLLVATYDGKGKVNGKEAVLVEEALDPHAIIDRENYAILGAKKLDEHKIVGDITTGEYTLSLEGGASTVSIEYSSADYGENLFNDLETEIGAGFGSLYFDPAFASTTPSAAFIRGIVPIKLNDGSDGELIAVTAYDQNNLPDGVVLYINSDMTIDHTALQTEEDLTNAGMSAVDWILGKDDCETTGEYGIGYDGDNLERITYDDSTYGKNLIEHLNNVSRRLGNSYFQEEYEAEASEATILGGFDVTFSERRSFKKIDRSGCFIVGPHVDNSDTTALYFVEGKTIADFTGTGAYAGITREDFVKIATGEIDADFVPVGVKEIYEYKEKNGNSVVRFRPRQDGRFSTLASVFADFWGRHQYPKMTPTSPVSNVEETLNIISTGKTDTGVGTAYVKSGKALSLKTGVKHGVISLALAAVVLVSTLSGGAKTVSVPEENPTPSIDDITSISTNIEAVRQDALKHLPDESEAARAAGAKLVIDAAKEKGYIEEKVDETGVVTYEDTGALLYNTTSRGWVNNASVLLNEVAKKLNDDTPDYQQQDGLKYTVTIFEMEDGKYKQDDEGSFVKITEERTLTQEEVEASGRSYYYSYEVAEGAYAAVGELVAGAAVAADKGVLDVADGKLSVVYTYNTGSLEGDIKEDEERNAGTALVGSSTELINTQHDAFAGEINRLYENGDIKVGSNAIVNEEDLIATDEVKAAAAKHAGDGATVICLSADRDFAYIKAEDGSALVKVAISGDLDKLAEDLTKAVGDKKLSSTYYRATDILADAFPGQTLPNQLADTFIRGVETNKNGNRVYQAEICEIVEGKVVESKGDYVRSKTNSSKMNTAVVAALSLWGQDAAVAGAEDYDVSKTGNFPASTKSQGEGK